MPKKKVLLSLDEDVSELLTTLARENLIKKSTLVDELLKGYFVSYIFKNDDPHVKSLTTSIRLKRENELLERELVIYNEQDKQEKLKRKIEFVRQQQEQKDMDEIIQDFEKHKKEDYSTVLKRFEENKIIANKKEKDDDE